MNLITIEQKVPDGEGGYRLALKIEQCAEAHQQKIHVMLPGIDGVRIAYEGAQSMIFLRRLRALIDATIELGEQS